MGEDKKRLESFSNLTSVITGFFLLLVRIYCLSLLLECHGNKTDFIPNTDTCLYKQNFKHIFV